MLRVCAPHGLASRRQIHGHALRRAPPQETIKHRCAARTLDQFSPLASAAAAIMYFLPGWITCLRFAGSLGIPSSYTKVYTKNAPGWVRNGTPYRSPVTPGYLTHSFRTTHCVVCTREETCVSIQNSSLRPLKQSPACALSPAWA
eukprot:656265-Prorocentrum_minimum.AAC.1